MISQRFRRSTVGIAVVALFVAVFATTATASTGFEAESYPAALNSDATSIALISGETAFSCNNKGFSATLSRPSETVFTSAVNDYTCNGSGATNLQMNGCNFAIQPGESGQENTGSFSIGPPGCGPVKLKSGSATCLEIQPQVAPASTYTTLNEGSGSKQHVDLTISAEGIQAKGFGICGANAGTFEWPWYQTMSVKGVDGSGNPIGVSFTEELEEEAHTPTIEASSYPTAIAGGGLDTVVTDAGTIECGEAAGEEGGETTLEGELTSAGDQLDLSETNTGLCITTMFESELLVSMVMNSCHYVLGVQNAGPPYSGTWGVACEKEGDAIEFKPYVLGKFRKCIKISPQEGLTGLDLSNAGGWGVGVDAEIGSVKYSQVGMCAGSEEAHSNGVISGQTTLLGTNESGQPIGVYLSGEGS
jgi:hypothetical protein